MTTAKNGMLDVPPADMGMHDVPDWRTHESRDSLSAVPGLSDTTIVGDDPTRAAAASTPTRIERGAEVGRYVVLDQLGRGGMGIVYAAFDPQLDRKVALKLLHTQAGGGTDATSGRPRLLREAQALAKLAHPNVITIHDVGTVEGAVFIAMEFIEGQTLGDWAEVGRPWREVIAMFAAAGRGIAAAHRAGIVHRDFKPDNVMIGKDGRPRVLDFGLARAADLGGATRAPSEALVEVSLLASSTFDTKLTVTGAVMGTPAYMAPEQHHGHAVDERSDQFSFCVAVYEALYGERPFAGDNLAALAFAVLHGKIREPPANSAVPGWLRKVVLRGLALEPSERYPSMDELLREFDRDPTRTRRIAVAGVGMLGFVVGLGVLGQRMLAEPQLCTGAEQHLIGVWDPDTRAQLHEAFAGSDTVYAEAALRGFVATLDDYASQWTAMHTEACAATRIRGEQSDEVLTLRMSCLDRSRAQLSALVEVYRDPNAQALERSLEAAESLPPLRLCADVEQLTLGVRPPETAAQQEQVDALRGKVDKARSLAQAGQVVQARELLATLLPEVDAVGYRPLIAEAELARGIALEVPKQQVVALERAVWMAEVSRHDRLAAEAWITLVKVYGVGVNDFDRSLDAVTRADAAIERIGADPELEIRLDVAHGIALTIMGREPEALVLLRQARAARVAAGQSETPVALNEIVPLVNALLSANLSKEAITLLNEVLGPAEGVLGSDHPMLARLRAVHGRSLYDQQDYVGAEASLRAALAVFERTNGEGSPQVGAILNALALVLEEVHRPDEALALYQRALTNFQVNNGPRHLHVAKALNNIGVLELALERYEPALAHIEECLAIKLEVFGPDSVEIGWAKHDICRALHGLGRDDEAVIQCRDAIRVYETLPEPKPNSVVNAYTSLAVAEASLGHIDEARSALELADAIIEKGGDIAKQVLGRHHFEHAKLLWVWGEHDEARTVAEQAIDHYAAASPYYQRFGDDVRAGLTAQAD
jgi:tetratricopeptide (TPR) repeat protein/predicted Ser/Thr protein kinase